MESLLYGIETDYVVAQAGTRRRLRHAERATEGMSEELRDGILGSVEKQASFEIFSAKESALDELIRRGHSGTEATYLIESWE